MQAPQPIIPPRIPKPQLVEPSATLQNLISPPSVAFQDLPTPPNQTVPSPPVLSDAKPQKFPSLSLAIETLQMSNDIFNRLYNYSDWDLQRSSIVRKYADAKRKYLSSCSPTQTPYLSGIMQYNLNRLTALERLELTDAYQKYMESFYQRVVKYMWEYYENVFKRYQLIAEHTSNKAMFAAEQSYVDSQLDTQRAVTMAEMQRDYITAQVGVIKDKAEQFIATVDNSLARMDTQFGLMEYEEMRASNEILHGKVFNLQQEFQGVLATLAAVSADESLLSDYTKIIQSMIYEATQKTLKATAQAALEDVRAGVELQKLNLERMQLFKEKVELAKSKMKSDAEVINATLSKYKTELISIKSQVELAKSKLDHAREIVRSIADYAETMVDQFRVRLMQGHMRDKERGHRYITELTESQTRHERDILFQGTNVTVEHQEQMKKFAGELDVELSEFKANLTNWTENNLTALESQVKLITEILHTLR